MNKKGFTLMELLAVIVILALLALITTTSITKLVKDSKTTLSETQLNLIKSAAEMWGAENLDKLPSSETCSYITLEDLKDYGLLNSNVIDPNTNNEISDELKIKITTTLSRSGNPVLNYEVDPEDISGCLYANAKPCSINGTVSKGSVVTCGTESFYIITSDTNNVTMLTALPINLDTKNPIQKSDAASIQFSNDSYWLDNSGAYKTGYTITSQQIYDNAAYVYDKNSLIYPYVNAYTQYLKKTLKVKSASAELMRIEQLRLLCPNGTDCHDNVSDSWAYSTSYWFGFADSSSSEPCYLSSGSWYNQDSTFTPTGFFYCGSGPYKVRPVVTISKSDIDI